MNKHQRNEPPSLSPAGKVKVESAGVNAQDRPHAQSRPNGSLETTIQSLCPNFDEKCLEDSRIRKHPPCKTANQPCGFWDWLSPSKRKDASGNTPGQEGYDPSTVLIPKQYYDEMTG